MDELWRPAPGWRLSLERELLQMSPHRLGAQITLALGGEGVDDTGTLDQHGVSFRDVGMRMKHGQQSFREIARIASASRVIA